MPETSIAAPLPLPPGSSGLPLIGETLQFLLDPNFAHKRHRQYGPIFRTHIAGRPTVVMSGLEANRLILASGFSNFSWREGWPPSFRELLGESLFLQEGEEHQRNRRLMMPAFHGKALENYIDTMAAITDRYCQQWAHQGDLVWFNEFKKLTFSIASTLLLGTDLDGRSASGYSIDQLSLWFTELTNGLFAFPLRWPGSTYSRALGARNRLLDHVAQVIEAKREQPGRDVLGLLMQSEDEEGQRLSLMELQVQAILLLFAGHETTTSLLTSVMMVLAQRQDLWQQLRAEQEAIGLDAPLDVAALKQMLVLDRVIKEAERLYPPVSGGFRGVVAETEFKGYRVPQGWQLLYRIPEAHYDGALFPEPEVFLPDRHLERGADYSLVTYGGGPRICIGMAFAQMEMKIVTSLLLRSYQWELQPNQNLSMVTIPTLRPRDGLRVKFRVV